MNESKVVDDLKQYIVDQNKVLLLFETVANLVSLRLAELVNGSKETCIEGESWDIKLFKAFDRLVIQEEEFKKGTKTTVRSLSKTHAPLVEFLKIINNKKVETHQAGEEKGVQTELVALKETHVNIRQQSKG